MKPERPRRADYPHFRPLATRWADNDVYGHLNNVVHYGLFDTVVNGWLIEQGLLEIGRSEVIGLVVSTGCDYFAELAFPDAIEGGLRVDRIGRSSVSYGIGIFRSGEPEAAAAGRFTHVYVDAATRRPVEIPAPMRARLEALALREA